MATPRKKKAGTKAPLAAEMRHRLMAKKVNAWVAAETVAGRLPRFSVAEPVVMPSLDKKGFSAHAFVGGEELVLGHMRDDGTVVFRPAFVASWKEVHLSQQKALETLTDFMPFWSHIEERFRREVDEEMEDFTQGARSEQIAAAKAVNEEYGTW